MKTSSIVTFLIIGFILVSCNKVKNTQRKLEGEWNVIEYSVTNFEGLTYYYTSTGTITFENFSGDNCDYIIDLTYDDQGTTSYKNESGKFELYEDGQYYDLNRTNTNGSITNLEGGRIIILTPNDLKTQFGDEFGLHQFILDKP